MGPPPGFGSLKKPKRIIERDRRNAEAEEVAKRKNDGDNGVFAGGFYCKWWGV